MSISERQNDILDIIKNLDISPTMYQNAIEKYNHLTTYLEQHGYAVTMYPQGSFALGTVVRPIHKGDDASYDLDFIYQVSSPKKSTTPKELRDEVEAVLRDSHLYDDRLIVNDECFTIEYADIGGIGFSIDIVPATAEDEGKIVQLKSESPHPELIDDSIAIPKSENSRYSWLTNNPKGYKNWFTRINGPYAALNRDEVRKTIFAQNTSLYNSVEDVPSDLERSPVQRVIQILKYHRNVYYSKLPGGKDLKPISAIIGTLVTQIAEKQSPTMGTFDLLQCVLSELRVYSEQLTSDQSVFKQAHPGKTLLTREGRNWVLRNPANPEDNLADSWNKNPRIASTFFKWLACVYGDLISSLTLSDDEFRTRVAGALGDKQVRRVWGKKYEKVPTSTFSASSQTKPWRNQ